MIRKSKAAFTLAICLILIKTGTAQPLKDKNWKYMTYNNLVMVGYQGWFNAEGDGADRGWNHYTQGKTFEPGNTKVDYWPDVTDYPVKYKTAFTLADGQPAYVFSSYDESTVDLHFKWMKDYGIDGAFMQRFITTVMNPKGNKHYEKVLGSALKAAKKYDRAISVMYDLSGMKAEDYTKVIDDWKQLIDKYKFNHKDVYENYLYHQKKPLVAVWGAGFNDNRKYSLKEVEKIIDFLKNDPKYGGCSVLLGVPTWWRELKYDTQDDSLLHTIIKKVDIVQPWFVGRYNENTYPGFKERIKDDLAWCTKNGLDYVPVVYPGFSWQNMRHNDPFDAIPRNKGNFLWKQLSGAIECGAKMIYVAMFDEIDEGTAIFKCAKDVPVGASKFVPYEKEIPADYYMWLTGQAAGMLKKEIPFQSSIPYRTY
jgi:glycoprotein endo-alpha-1,2-mannosidase